MTWQTRPAAREDMPLIIGIAGPTKSGKTLSAHRLARGLAPSGKIVMLNSEGKKGHQYAEKFTYLACDIEAPYSPSRYEDAIRTIGQRDKPNVLIIDSASHMHDGPGGMLEEVEATKQRMAKGEAARIDKMTAPAWAKVRPDENRFIYTMLDLPCHVILCFRAKEKIRITKEGKWLDLGWQPIASERVAFETIFTVMLPPHSKGVPDLGLSDMREPFDAMIPPDKPIDEQLGRRLAEWARGAAPKSTPSDPPDRKADLLAEIKGALTGLPDNAAKSAVCAKVLGVKTWAEVERLPIDVLEGALIPVSIGGPSKIEAEGIKHKEAHP